MGRYRHFSFRYDIDGISWYRYRIDIVFRKWKWCTIKFC